MFVIEWLLGGIAAALLLPVCVLFVQVVLAYWPGVRRSEQVISRPRLAVLVPAHNEAAVIVATLETLRPQLQAGDRLLVVADNCTDETANLARAAGGEVVERTDAARRGKGYALDFGVRHLAADPPEVLIIVDADCQVGEGSLALLAKKSALAGCNAPKRVRPVQALYLMHAPKGAGLKARIAAFAWIVKNRVRPLGWHRLGWPCQLMGTGMAFPWPLAETMQLANANIVEDMKLGIDLALSGRAPLFCPEALVTSEFPLADAAVKSQRTRWEHGHLSMILQELPRLLGGALAKGDVRLLAMALDLAVPPLALLAMLLVGLFAVAGAGLATGWLGLGFLPFQLASLGLGLFAAAVLLAWLGWGRQVVSGIDLLSIPVYVLAKIPLYLKFWGKRQKEWVRTERE